MELINGSQCSIKNKASGILEKRGSNDVRVSENRWGFVESIFQSVSSKAAKIYHERWTFSPLRFLFVASFIFGAKSKQPDPFPAQIELSSLNGTNGFVIYGKQKNEYSGSSVTNAGDLNGDGINDIVIGAPGANLPSDRQNAGRIYVVFGSQDLGLNGALELSSLNGTNGFSIRGAKANDHSGNSVSSGGDVNGDGMTDVLIGANLGNPTFDRGDAGKTYLVFGSREIVSKGYLELYNLNGSNGFVINGDRSGDQSGKSVSVAGDVNGDGIADLIIGAHLADPKSNAYQAGKSYVVFGNKGIGKRGVLELSRLNGTNGTVINGEQFNDQSGISVSNSGDINGDGIADIIIGAYNATIGTGKYKAGKTYIVFGSKNFGENNVLDLQTLNNRTGIILNGESVGDRFGYAVTNSGDINGDGIADIITTAFKANHPTEGSGGGKTYVLYGSTNIKKLMSFNLKDLNGTQGYVINGEKSHDRSGTSISSGGDINGDGIADLIIGAYYAQPSADRMGAGNSYIVFGGNHINLNGRLSLSSLDGLNGFILNGENTGDNSGFSLSIEGDVNGDGVDDFIIGAPRADPDSVRTNAGKTYVIFGRKLKNQRSTSLTQMTLPLTQDSKSTNKFTKKAIPTNLQRTLSRLIWPTTLNSLRQTLSAGQQVNDSSHEQSITLPIVLVCGGLIFVSGVVISVICLKNQKTEDIDPELDFQQAAAQSDDSTGIYQFIPHVSNYEEGDIPNIQGAD